MSFFGKYYFVSSKQLESEDDESIQDLLEGRHVLGEGRVDTWVPPADIYECEGGVVILVELAGIVPQDVEISIAREILTISGRRREECPVVKKNYLQMEIHHGVFKRSLELPGPVETEGAKAHLENGILEIFLPSAKRIKRTTAILRVDWESTGRM